MAKLTKRKDGRYQTKVYLGQEDSKSKYKYIYGKTRKELNIKANELKYKKENNIYINPKNMFLEDFLYEWLEIYKPNIEITTYDLYKMYIIKHISPHIGRIKINKILPVHIQKFYNVKLKESKGQTVRKYHGVLHIAFEYAVKNDMLLYNPCDRIDKPKIEKYTPVVCEEDTFFKLLEITRDTFDEVPIILAAGMSFRRSIVFGLRWPDINFTKNTISVKNAKVRFNKYIEKKPKSDASIREIFMPNIVRDTLLRYKNRKKVLSKYVCDEYKPDAYSKHFKKLLEKNNLPHMRFHDLRHFNAILMLKLNIPDKIAAKRTGHSTERTLKKVYQHVTTDMDRLVAEKLNQALTKSL